MVKTGKALQKKSSTSAKINSEAPNSTEKRKEVSKVQSSQKANMQNHNGETHVFSHAPANRGK